MRCMNDRVTADNSYIDEWSLALDVAILLKTVPLVFKDPNAYRGGDWGIERNTSSWRTSAFRQLGASRANPKWSSFCFTKRGCSRAMMRFGQSSYGGALEGKGR